METSWYMLGIVPQEKKELPKLEKEETPKEVADPEEDTLGKARERVRKEREANLPLPQVGSDVIHFVVDDKENPLWEKFQDGNRPAWAPDFKRLGYAIVFRREALPKLAVKLGIKRPENAGPNELSFDDVWAVGVVPQRNPMYMPAIDLDTENWWLSTQERGSALSPMIVPGGVTVATGGKRLSDIVVEILRTPENYPRNLPLEENDEYSEFTNPLVPILPRGGIDNRAHYNTMNTGTASGYGWAGVELFRTRGWY